MSTVTLHHFKSAAADIGLHGDNDTLPFDVDNNFIKENQEELATIAYEYFSELEKGSPNHAANAINSLQVFSERLLVPVGTAGFRIATKIHPFWNLYINGLGVAIAEHHEPQRDVNAHSYRYDPTGDRLFDRDRTWRAYRESTLADEWLKNENGVVIQTDISNFYEHIYHHRLENCVKDLFGEDSTVAVQIDRFLSKFSSGRSFGLPVGGQCSRILAEVMMSPIDKMLSAEDIRWHRYVDDFTIMANSQEDAYRSLAVLSHALADYGLSLNRTKTTILRSKHYLDYVNTQLGNSQEERNILREVDLHFDPYSDTATSDYDKLKDTVKSLDVRALLELETMKGQPDTFLVAQIGRTLKYQPPSVAIQLCETLLHPKNLNLFRASWSKIMRGVAAIRMQDEHETIFEHLDKLLDEVPKHSANLLVPEANCLHYLKTIRFKHSDDRAKYTLSVHQKTASEMVRRACIECWRNWRYRPMFNRLRNQWENLGIQEQRMLWLAAGSFGDEGMKARNQLRMSSSIAWELGIERNNKNTFSELYMQWCENDI